jgi:hydroxymethylbilane synthase
MKLRLGTRGSDLARTQASTVARNLDAAGCRTELAIIRTAGDRSAAPSFGSIGPQGVFVREIEDALLAGDIDLAVHSFKDLPTQSPAGLVIAAVPARLDPADVLLLRPAAHAPTEGALLALVTGAKVGTASARRRAWLKHFRPDLVIESLRGNVPTRINRLKAGRYDAILLAGAGVERLRAKTDVLEAALEGLMVLRLDPRTFVPAPAQGALAIQCRRGDDAVVAAIGALDHAASRAAVAAERDVLARAEGGCDIAFGAHCRATDDGFELVAMLERDGRVLTAEVRGSDTATLGAAAWHALGADR